MGDTLDDHQADAVDADPNYPTRVTAGAGSGKTRVLTHHMARAIARGVNPGRLMCVTYSRRAAGEMKERATGLLGEDGHRVMISTIHSACFHLLTEWAGEYLPHLVMGGRLFLATAEQQREAARAAAVAVARAHGLALDEAQATALVSAAKVGASCPLAHQEAAALTATACRAHRRLLRRHGVLEYPDLVLFALQLIDEHPALLWDLGKRIQYVVVDEYHDVNDYERALIERFAQNGRLYVVGDPRQSIYAGWRGGRLDIFDLFDEAHPGAQRHHLELAYRSQRRIVALANWIAAPLPAGDRPMIPARAEDGPAPIVHAEDTPRDEAAWIADEIDRLVDHGVADGAFSEVGVAILCRNAGQHEELRAALRARGIPVRRRVGKLVACPAGGVIRAWCALARDESDAAALRVVAGALHGADLAALLDRAGSAPTVAGLRERYPAGLEPAQVRGLDLVVRLQGVLSAAWDALDAPGLVDALVREAEIDRVASARGRHDPHGAIRDIAALRDLAAREPDLGAFLLALAEEEGSETNGVLLSLIHGEKGREFDIVFMPGLNEGVLPTCYALEEGAEALLVETAVANVGVTRARTLLYLTYTRFRHTRLAKTRLSRFLVGPLAVGLVREVA